MGIARAATKWCVQVRDVRELPRRINEAFKIATSGRPGPVIGSCTIATCDNRRMKVAATAAFSRRESA
eukprot:SAG11_NODE_408_length_9704_cov_6.496774_9_plen_68_part_00